MGETVIVLNRLLSAPGNIPSLKEFHKVQGGGQKDHGADRCALVDSFLTALDREDVEMLSAVLYKIPKTVEKIRRAVHTPNAS